MTFFWTLRRWIILFLLRIALSWRSHGQARRIIKFLGFLLPFDRSWVCNQDDRGMWIGEHISSEKKEALEDRVANSDIVLLWVPGTHIYIIHTDHPVNSTHSFFWGGPCLRWRIPMRSESTVCQDLDYLDTCSRSRQEYEMHHLCSRISYVLHEWICV